MTEKEWWKDQQKDIYVLSKASLAFRTRVTTARAQCPYLGARCIDLDLNFSPSTNLLPIRRLGLAIGQAAEVKAAWLRFPSFELELLPQRYRRLDETRYRYESAGGQFVADLQVNPSGFATDYPGLWQAEATSE